LPKKKKRWARGEALDELIHLSIPSNRSTVFNAVSAFRGGFLPNSASTARYDSDVDVDLIKTAAQGSIRSCRSITIG
jgi:hypothetical protein